MQDFALVTEGVTDHAIIKNILIGYFKEQREPDVYRELPNPQAKNRHGGWTLVIQYLKEKKFRQALQMNRYIIVQVDTDVAEDAGFDVPKQGPDGPISMDRFIADVIDRLKFEIGSDDWAAYGEQFIFAIGVEQLDCWLLPLWFADAKGKQIANCTTRLGGCQKLREKLTTKNYHWITHDKKDYLSYDIASRDYRKRDILLIQGRRNPSLNVFLNDLDRRNILLLPID